MSTYPYASFPRRPSEGFTNMVAANVSDSEDLPVPGFLMVFGAGDLKVTPVDAPEGHEGEPCPNVYGLFPVAVRRVWATGTTATDIKVVW
jgi:hypothetical protein